MSKKPNMLENRILARKFLKRELGRNPKSIEIEALLRMEEIFKKTRKKKPPTAKSAKRKKPRKKRT